MKRFTLKNNLAILVSQGVQQALPPEYRNQPSLIELRILSKVQRLQSQKQAEELSRLLKQFQEAQIPVIPFKGPLLAQELYGDVTMRNSCDLDILVEPGDLSRASQCLQSLGYEPRRTVWDTTAKRQDFYQRRNPQIHRVFTGNGITVELHWRICYRFAVPFGDIQDSGRQGKLFSQSATLLGQEENLCYLITHGAGHGFRQLRWLLEIHTLLSRADFAVSSLYAKMKQRGVAMLLLEALLLLYRLPGFEMPEKLIILAEETPLLTLERWEEQTVLSWRSSENKEVSNAKNLVNAVYPLLQRNTPEEGLDGRIYKRLLPVLGERPSFLLTLLGPTRDDLEQVDLPDNLFFLYYLLRPALYLRRLRRKKQPTATKPGGKEL